MGLAGYYRRFIKGFGSIAQPLTKKTHKLALKEPFVWTDEDQVAFETLRTCLTTKPILAYPDFSKQFLLFTDACNYGIGAILSQIQDGNEVVIAYASRQLRKPELNYATVEKEALAVIFAIKSFRHYLLDEPFLVISDHSPLQWLQNQKDNNGRLGRWAIQLASTNYRIQYKPGRVHQNADCLSRIKVAVIQEKGKQKEICLKQAEDPLCIHIRNYLDNGELTEEHQVNNPVWVKEIEFYQVIDGVLYRKDFSTKTKKRNEVKFQVVLPLFLRPLVLKELHDEPLSGHLAYQRTYLKVKNNYYWPSMRADIKEYCRVCEACLANTKSTLRAFLHPHELAKAPFDVVGMDFMGPFTPPSTNGNKYIMVITDYFSKWTEIAALPDQTAVTTADCFMKLIVQRHGLPKAIVSDRGTNFTSAIFRHLCKTLEINQRLTTAYNPASNGQTERFNRTLTTMLRKELKDGQHENWEQMMGDVCFAYRNSVHSSTLETPFFLLYGRDPNLPIHNFLDAVPLSTHSPTDYTTLMLERLRIGFQVAREENRKAREKQREQYNKRAVLHEYKVGDRVLIDIKVLPQGESRKFVSKFKGPYRVIKLYDNKTVDIADNSFMPRRVHVNRLRPMFDSMIWRDEFCPDIEKEQENLLHEVDLESDTTLENRDNRPLAEGNIETSQLSKTDSDLQQANDDTIATERLNEDNTENDTLEITLLTSQPDPTIVTTDPTFTVQQERSKRIVRKPQRLIEE